MDRLLDAMLAHMKAAPLEPPLQEIIVIQGRGLDRWISQRAALVHGGWGFVETLYPRPFLLRAFAAVLDGGAPPIPVADGTMSLESGLRVAATLPAMLEDPRFSRVAGVVDRRAGDGDGRAGAVRRDESILAMAPRIADVLDRIAQHRVDFAQAWSEGRAAPISHADEPWLAELWRRISKDAPPSRLVVERERFRRACMEGVGPLPGLPLRVTVFGVSTLAPAFLELLEALSHRIEVSIHALDPCPQGHGHALVRSWGVEATEFATLVGSRIAALGATAVHHDEIAPIPGSVDGDTLLALLQARLRGAAVAAVDGRSPPRRPIDEAFGDDTVSFHPCRGPIHELERAHDAVVDLLRRDPTLEPRDVAILTPDLERVGPIAEAVFGARRDASGRSVLPFSITDSDREESQAIEAFVRVLELARSRCERREVLETLALEPIARAFDLGAADVEVLEQWCDAAQVRWGLDEAHRALHGRRGEIIGTWRWGLDRLHLGSVASDGVDGALADDEPVSPAWAVEGSDTERLARLESFIEAISPLALACGTARPLASIASRPAEPIEGSADSAPIVPESSGDWLSIVEQLADRVFDPRSRGMGGAFTLSRLATMRMAARASGYADGAHRIGAPTALGWIIECLRDVHPGRGVLAAGITIAALQPMRSIPFRVIVLVGMGDGAIPRRVAPVGFDLVAAERRPGDRDARLDDRQVMLETIFAASRSLVITWPGVDPASGLPMAPSVLVDELLEALPEARHEANAPGAIALDHDRAPDGAREASPHTEGTAVGKAEIASTIDRAATATVVTIEALEQFWRHPAEAHLRALGVGLEWSSSDAAEEDPIGAEFERELLDAMQPTSAEGAVATIAPAPLSTAALVGRGLLPRGAARQRVQNDLQSICQEWRHRADELLRGAGAAHGLHERFDTIDIDTELPPHAEVESPRVRFMGRLPILRGVGPLIITTGELDNPRIVLRLWLRMLAASVALATIEAPTAGVLIDRRPSGRGDERAMKPAIKLVPGPAPDEAREHLALLAALFLKGQRMAIPFMPATSISYAHHLEKRGGVSASQALALAQKHFFDARGDAGDRALRLLFEPSRFFEGSAANGDPERARPGSFQWLAERVARPIMRAHKQALTARSLVKPAPARAKGRRT